LQNSKAPVSVNDAEKLALVYLPGLLLQVDVLYTDRKGTYSERRRYAALIPDPERRSGINFEKFAIEPNEAREGFHQRCLSAADDKEDVEIDKVQTRFDKKLNRLHTKLRREERELDEDRETLDALKMETMVNYGKTLANIAGGFFGGRKRRSGISSALTKRRQKQNAKADVRESIEEIDVLREQLDEMTKEHEQEMIEIDNKWTEVASEIKVINVSPLKKNIELELFGVVWQPHWVVKVKGRVKVIAAG